MRGKLTTDRVFQNIGAHELGIMHAHLSRKIGKFQKKILEENEIMSVEWLVLGIVDYHKTSGGIRITDLADILEVKTTYITAALNQLRQKELVKTHAHTQDGRAKLVTATKKGSKLVATIEDSLRQEADMLLQDPIIGKSFAAYTSLLVKVTKYRPENSSK